MTDEQKILLALVKLMFPREMLDYFEVRWHPFSIFWINGKNYIIISAAYIYEKRR